MRCAYCLGSCPKNRLDGFCSNLCKDEGFELMEKQEKEAMMLCSYCKQKSKIKLVHANRTCCFKKECVDKFEFEIKTRSFKYSHPELYLSQETKDAI